MLTGKGILKIDYGNKEGKGILRAGYEYADAGTH